MYIRRCLVTWARIRLAIKTHDNEILSLKLRRLFHFLVIQSHIQYWLGVMVCVVIINVNDLFDRKDMLQIKGQTILFRMIYVLDLDHLQLWVQIRGIRFGNGLDRGGKAGLK